MARSWQNPRWRRILLQATLWLILAAAVGVAALVTRQRNQSQYVNLNNPVSIDSITVHLPNKWFAAIDPDSLGVIASERGNSDQQRRLMIRLQPATSGLSPAQFLAAAGFSLETIMPGNDSDEDIPSLSQEPQPIQIAGAPGILKRSLRSYPASTPDADETIREEIIACAILPTHQAILIRLYCPPEDDQDNTTLVQRIAAAITLSK
jgi:hypothetical protein